MSQPSLMQKLKFKEIKKSYYSKKKFDNDIKATEQWQININKNKVVM